jgi:hypothetical protein
MILCIANALEKRLNSRNSSAGREYTSEYAFSRIAAIHIVKIVWEYNII